MEQTRGEGWKVLSYHREVAIFYPCKAKELADGFIMCPKAREKHHIIG